MLDDQITLLVIPQKDGHVFRLNLSSFLIKSMITGALILTLASLAIFIDYLFIIEKGQAQRLLAKELKLQQFRIQSIHNRLDDTTQQLVKFEEFDRKLRIISDLQDTRPAVRFAAHEENLSEEEQQDPSNQILSQLNRLSYDIKVREASFFQLDAFLKERKDRLARTPSIAPAQGHLSSSFGPRSDPFTGKTKYHNGLDFSNGPFTPIYAPADGVVVNTFHNGGYGEFLVIDHGYNIVSRYGHLAKYEVSVGQRVKRGDLIARMGNTGRSTATHLHYEVLVRDQHVDPEKYILE
ncbi:MAG: M23 family metallopeptidase [bacterium]|nr:M23 family metallopeptidase [bacterium]